MPYEIVDHEDLIGGIGNVRRVRFGGPANVLALERRLVRSVKIEQEIQIRGGQAKNTEGRKCPQAFQKHSKAGRIGDMLDHMFAENIRESSVRKWKRLRGIEAI